MSEVTVVLPTYNRLESLKKAIKSVQDQTVSDWKMIIVDDGSRDGTREYLDGMKDERISYVCNEKNGGPAYSRNVGVRLANTKYIAFQDSDTIWHPGKLEMQMTRIKEDDIVMVYHPYCLKGQVYPPEDVPLEEKQGDIYQYLLYLPMIGTPCMLLKKKVFEKVGGFTEELRCLEDYELSLRIAKEGFIEFLPNVLLKAEDSDVSVSKNAGNEMDALFYIMTRYHNDLEMNFFAKKLMFNRISKLAKEQGLMSKYYERLQIYLECTNQSLEDMMKLYG